MPEKEERLCEMFRKPCGCAGEPEQNIDRGAEISEGVVLPERRPKLGYIDSDTECRPIYI